MPELRVFEVANQFGIDVRAVQDALRQLGVGPTAPEAKLNATITRKVQDLLAGGQEHPPMPSSAEISPRPDVRGPRPLREASVRRPARTLKPPRVDSKRSRSAFARNLREEHSEAIRGVIPALAANLQVSLARDLEEDTIVAFHDRDAAKQYGFCTLGGEPLSSADFNNTDISSLLTPIRNIDSVYRVRGWTPPNAFVAFDLVRGHVWFAGALKALQHKEGERFDGQTLARVTVRQSAGEPPRLAPKAQKFTPGMVPPVANRIGASDDRPEESFLLHEEFLHLAVDAFSTHKCSTRCQST